MGCQPARNRQCGGILGIPKTPLKHEIGVTCELLEDTQGSGAKGAVVHLQFLVQPCAPCNLGTGQLEEVPSGDPCSQFISGL